RRHTSFSRDWSSDVCSSDLKGSAIISILIAFVAGLAIGNLMSQGGSGDGEQLAEIGMEEGARGGDGPAAGAAQPAGNVERFRARSEERRVGRESGAGTSG